MKKKILLLIILLMPFIISAEMVLDETIDSNTANMYDNGKDYVIAEEDKMYVINKDTGTLYDKTFYNAYGLTWLNYDYENVKFSEKPSSHYIVADYENEKIYLLDNKLNEVKKSTGFYEEIYDYYIKDNEINFIGTYDNIIYIYTYDKDLNFKRETSLEVEGVSWVSPYYDEKSDIIRNQDSELIFTFDEENNLIESTPNVFLFVDNGWLVKYDAVEDEEINSKKITDDYIVSSNQIGENFYVLYFNNRGNLMLSIYDMNLNLIKEKNLKTEYNIDGNYLEYEYMFVINSKPVFSATILEGQDVFYEIDEELNLTKKSITEMFKGNLFPVEGIDTRLAPFSIDSIKFQKSINKILDNISSSDDMLVYQFSSIKQIKDKLYAFIPKVEYNDELLSVTISGYLYVYNEEDKLEKKTLITTLTLTDEEMMELYDGSNGLTYIDNKIIYYQQILKDTPDSGQLDCTSLYIELDEVGNVINEIEMPPYIEDKYILASYSLEGNYELIIQLDEFDRVKVSRPTELKKSSTNPRSQSSIPKERAESRRDNLRIRLIKNELGVTINSLNGETKLSSTTPGEEVTINITPQDGYEVKDIKVTTKSGKVITVTDNKFIMPNEDIIIDVTYELKSTIKEIVENPYTLDAIIITISVAIISLVAFIYNKKKTIYLK